MSAEERRWMGVDLGAARIGLSVSDVLGLTARPLDPIQARGPKKDLAALESRIRDHAPVELVIGLPLRLSGEEGEAAGRSRAFAERLQLRNPKLVIHLWDERFTTVEAEDHLRSRGVHGQKRRERVDSEAATILLQRFLDAEIGTGHTFASPGAVPETDPAKTDFEPLTEDGASRDRKDIT